MRKRTRLPVRWAGSLGALLAIALSIGLVWADVPRTIAYQGKLAEANGTPLVGEHVLTLRLYGAATGGAKLWEEQHAISLAALDNGLFALVLGAVTPFGQGINFNEPLWLTIEVDGAGEFSPRQPLSSVGYALNADMLDGLDSTQLLAAAGQGDITAVTAGTGLAGGGETGAVSLSVDVGTTAGKIVQLDAAGALPAVSGANLTGVIATLPDGSVASAQIVDGTIAAADTADTFLIAGSGVTVAKDAASWSISAVGSGGDLTSVAAGAGLTGGATSGDAALDVGAGTGILVSADAVSVDVGTTAGQIVQLDAAGALPAVSGANLAGLNAAALASGTVADARLSANVSLLGPSIGAAELEDGAVTQAKLAADSVGAAALAADAIQAGDIEVGDLPAHAGVHQPGGPDALPTAAPVGVGPANGAGASTSLARADHVHEGVHSVAVAGQPQLSGDVALSAGSNVTLTQAGGAIAIAATAGASGNRVTGFASNSVAISSAGDTDLIAATITKSQATSALLIIASVQLTHTSGGNKTVDLKLFRGSTQLDATYRARVGTGGGQAEEVPATVHVWDASGAGTYTVTLRGRASANGATATVRRLTVIELL